MAPSPPAVRGGSGAMFDLIAKRYDLLNRMTSLGLDARWRRHLVAAVVPERLPAPGAILDVATGTADVALALVRAAPQVHVTGIDPSVQMLARGREKWAGCQARYPAARIELREGSAEALPDIPGGWQAATMAFGIRNVPDRAQALVELARVLRPGAPLAILELTEPASGLLAVLARFWVHRVVPFLGARINGPQAYEYLARSIAAFPPGAAFADEMREAGFVDVRAKRLSFGAAHLFVGQAPGRSAR